MAGLLASALFLASQSAQAASTTWNATPGTADWVTGTNWVSGSAPGALGTLTNQDTATFLTNTNGNGTTSAVVVDTTRNIKSITFGVSSATPASFTIGSTAGDSIQLSSAGSIAVTGNISGSNITETVNAPLVLEPLTNTTAGTYTFNNGSGTASNILVIGGTVTGGTTSAGITLTLTGTTGSQANEVKGIISDGGATGGMAVSKTGNGIWKMSGANTYTGGTTVTAGTLSVGTTGNLGGSSSALTFDGGTLQITGTALTSMSGIGHTVNYNAGKTVGLDISTSGNTFTLDQVLNATSALSKAGAGTLIVNQANNYSGTTTVSAGTLVASGTNSSAGAITLTGGTLQLNNASNGGLASGTLTMANSALQSLLANQALSNNVVINGTSSVTGANNLTLNGTFTNSGANRTLTSSITGGNTLTLAGNVYLSETTATGRTLSINGTGATLISGVIANANGSGQAGGLTISNTGTTTLSNTNTYTGVTTIGASNNATVSVGTIGNGGVAGNLGAAGNAASNLVFSGGSSNVSPATLLYTGATAGTDRGFTINAATFGAFNISNSLTNLTVSGSAAATTGSLVKSGAGTLTLAAANSYTGTTTVSAGTLALSAAGAIGTGGGSAISMSAGTTLTESAANAITGTSSIALNTSSSVSLSQANNFTGAISFGNGTSVLNLSDLNAIASSSGISGSAGTINLLSNSAGTFETSGSFSFTTGAGMTLNVANNGSGSGNALQFGNNSSTVAIANNRTLAITGANGYSLILPTVNLSVGTSGGVLNPTTASVSVGTIGNLNTTAGTTPIGLGGTAAGNSVTGAISDGTGGAVTSLNKSGTGSWTLSGTNTYTGKTTISSGTLQFAKTASLYNGSTGSWTAANITAASGSTLALNVGGTGEFSATDVNTLLTNISVASSTTTGLQSGAKIAFNTANASGGTFTQGNLIANSTGANGGAIGLTKLGAGTLVLDKANTYTGATTLGGGTLALGVNNAFAASAFNFNGGTLAVGTFTNSTVGTLSLTANSAVTLGSGGVFAFADSHLLDWSSYTLSITGTFIDGASIRFGSSASALTGAQLALISINGGGAALDSSGYLTAIAAIPEPSTYALMGGVIALAGAFMVRRRNLRA